VVALVAAGVYVVSNQGDDSSSSAEVRASDQAEAELDGTQAYSTIAELHGDITAHGNACENLTEDPYPSLAIAQGRCDLTEDALVLQLWRNGKHRDDGTTELITNLLSADLGYCFVIGNEDGAWSINAGADHVLCRRLASQLGGRLFEEVEASPTTSPAPPPPAAPPAPTVFTGAGDSVVAITKPGGSTGTVLATITGNDAGRFFAVQAIDGDQDLLVNTTEPYSGTVLMDADRGGTTQLQVTATGPWSVTLSDPLSAPQLAVGANTGVDDQVFLYEGPAGVAQIDANAGGRFFAVVVYTGEGRELLVNTTDPYSGAVPMPAGPGFVTVTATGNWSIAIG
jgi:hypothetical protein